MENNLKSWKPPFNENSVALAKANVMSRIDETKKVELMELNTSSNKKWLGIAAALLVMVGLGVAIYLLSSVAVYTGQNIRVTEILPDGSQAEFMDGKLIYNKLAWKFKRTLDFEGVGHFTVISGREFTVNTSNAQIKVLGTSFTVWANSDDVFVHCTDGSVEVKRGLQTAVLNPFEFTATSGEELLPKAVFKTAEFLIPSRERILRFQSVPLAIVIKQLELTKKIRVKNDLPSDFLYSGTLDTDDLDACFEVLCKPYGAVFEKKSKDEIWIYLE